MEQLINEIQKSIEKTMEKYIQTISKTYTLKEMDLKKMWKNISVDSISENDETDDKTKKVKEKKSCISTSSSCSGCPYIYSKGAKKGIMCGVMPKTKDTKYCSTHKKYEGEEPKEKKILPKRDKSKNDSDEDDSDKEEKKISNKNDIDESLSRKKLLRKEPLLDNKLINEDTKLVFDSENGKLVVIGKFLNGKLENISDEDIETCKKYNYAFSEKHIKNKLQIQKEKLDEESSDSEDEINKILNREKPEKEEEKQKKKEKKSEEEEQKTEDEEEKPKKKEKKLKKTEEEEKPKKKEKKSEEEENPKKKEKKLKKKEKTPVESEDEKINESDEDISTSIISKSLGIKEAELSEDDE